MFKFLEGRKTYMAGWALVFLAVGTLIQNWVDGQPLDLERNIEQLLLGFAIISGRSAITNATGSGSSTSPPPAAAAKRAA
jgi:hypothetical protein